MSKADIISSLMTLYWDFIVKYVRIKTSASLFRYELYINKIHEFKNVYNLCYLQDIYKAGSMS